MPSFDPPAAAQALSERNVDDYTQSGNEDLLSLWPFVASAAAGLVLGLERRHAGAAIGLKAFTLIALFGTLIALIAEVSGSAVIIAAGLVVVGAAGAAASLPQGPSTRGALTIVTAVWCFALGAATWYGYTQAALVLAVASAVLLRLSELPATWSARWSGSDIATTAQFLVLAIAILPIAPDQDYGPYGAFNPYYVWLVVVAAVFLSWLGFAALRFVRPGAGVLMGLAGGTISSTATTIACARAASGPCPAGATPAGAARGGTAEAAAGSSSTAFAHVSSSAAAAAHVMSSAAATDAVSPAAVTAHVSPDAAVAHVVTPAAATGQQAAATALGQKAATTVGVAAVASLVRVSLVAATAMPRFLAPLSAIVAATIACALPVLILRGRAAGTAPVAVSYENPAGIVRTLGLALAYVAALLAAAWLSDTVGRAGLIALSLFAGWAPGGTVGLAVLRLGSGGDTSDRLAVIAFGCAALSMLALQWVIARRTAGPGFARQCLSRLVFPAVGVCLGTAIALALIPGAR